MEVNFDSMMQTTNTKKNLKQLKEKIKELSALSKVINQDLRNLRAYRDGGFNTTGIQTANKKRASESTKRKEYILSNYSLEKYPDKQSMYRDISKKENISIHTAIKYFRK